MPMGEKALHRMYLTFKLSERRVAPMLDNRAVTQDQFNTMIKQKGFPMSKSQLAAAWKNMKIADVYGNVADPTPEELFSAMDKDGMRVSFRFLSTGNCSYGHDYVY